MKFLNRQINLQAIPEVFACLISISLVMVIFIYGNANITRILNKLNKLGES